MPLNKGYLTAKTDKASDEVYTPAYAVQPLIKYVKLFNPNATIWCPFDLSNSAYVKIFEKNNFKVLHSHIDEGQNFFYYEPEENYDIIISNPPFSQKDDVLKRLYELNKPYAMLLPIPSLEGQARFPYIKNKQQKGIIMADKNPKKREKKKKPKEKKMTITNPSNTKNNLTKNNSENQVAK